MKPLYGKIIALVLLLALFLGLFLMGVRESIPQKNLVEISNYEPWSEEVLETAASLPLQEGGRIKPLETRAGYALLQLRGDRRIRIIGQDGEKVEIGPVAWMMDVFFRPEVAAFLPTFRIDNSEVLKAIGAEFENRKKRDRYSFAELEPYFDTLMDKAGDYQKLQSDNIDLSPVEEQTIELASSLRNYFYLAHHFDFVREGIVLPMPNGDSKRVNMSTVLQTSGMIVEQIRSSQQKNGELPPQLANLLGQVSQSAETSKFFFHPLPPTDTSEKKWSSVGELIESTLIGQVADPEQAIKDVHRLEQVYVAYGKGEKEFAKDLEDFRVSTMKRAGEDATKMVKREVSFNRIDWYRKALSVFGFGSLFLLAYLFAPTGMPGKVLRISIWGFSVTGLILILAGIVHRYLVVERPPVTNLYETIPYITAGAIVVFLLTEFFTKGRIALLIAPMVGMGGMVLAAVFQVAAAADSLDPLVAVLRSNFWLTTHVLIVTYGYAAGLSGALLSFVYIMMKLLGLMPDQKVARSMTRMVYGVVAFTLVLSLIGTVLGGIWANYSWGRFWGWDPKENGALMIVLWTLFILHGRAAGLFCEWGLHLASAFGGVVVTFSWFHVNMLGTGLHSYGFTDGKSAIWFFYGLACLIIVLGFAFSIWEEQTKQARKQQLKEIARAQEA